MEQRHAAPTTQRPDDQPCESIAAVNRRDSMTTAMLALDAKSNGNVENAFLCFAQISYAMVQLFAPWKGV